MKSSGYVQKVVTGSENEQRSATPATSQVSLESLLSSVDTDMGSSPTNNDVPQPSDNQPNNNSSEK